VFNNASNSDSVGHKRSITAVFKQMAESGSDIVKILAQINDIIIKTVISGQPELAHLYRSCQPDDVENSMCFEILG
jgi:tubulin polyglutamylase TTLL6/13